MQPWWMSATRSGRFGAGRWAPVSRSPCWRSAWGAHDVLETARVFDSLGAAVAEASLVAGLTGRRDTGVPVSDVRELAPPDVAARRELAHEEPAAARNEARSPHSSTVSSG